MSIFSAFIDMTASYVDGFNTNSPESYFIFSRKLNLRVFLFYPPVGLTLQQNDPPRSSGT